MLAITINSDDKLIKKLIERGFRDDDPAWFFMCYQRIIDGKSFTLKVIPPSDAVLFLIYNDIPYRKSVKGRYGK